MPERITAETLFLTLDQLSKDDDPSGSSLTQEAIDQIRDMASATEIQSRMLVLANDAVRKALGESTILPDNSSLQEEWRRAYPELTAVTDRLALDALNRITNNSKKDTETSAA